MLDLTYPFTGRWLVQNSPADRVPSHGTNRFGTRFAIDFVPLAPHLTRSRMSLRDLVRAQPPKRSAGFGRPITAPLTGHVVAVHDEEPDHASFRGLPSVGYALTQRRRAALGWAALAGNHIAIRHDSGVLVVLCHLRQGSVGVAVGQQVVRGQQLAACGNSGNSTEPHLHLQAVDRLGADALAIPITFAGLLPRNGTVLTLD